MHGNIKCIGDITHTGEDGSVIHIKTRYYEDALAILLKARGVTDIKDLKPAILDERWQATE